MAVLSESFENWPMLIPNQAEHIDPQIQREDFEREATRLFVPDDELNVSIKVCRQGGKKWYIWLSITLIVGQSPPKFNATLWRMLEHILLLVHFLSRIDV